MTQLEFGKRVLNLRTKLGLTMMEFGLRCGLDAGHISKLEKGLIMPQLDTIYAIANGLDISLSELLDSETPRVSSFGKTMDKVISYMMSMTPEEINDLYQIAKIIKKS